MYEPYDFKAIQEKWQSRFETDGIFTASKKPDGPKKYVLEMFPYPSANLLHVGHVENYTIGDVIARWWKKCGFDVLHPFGFDAFGLPAERYAMRVGSHPAISTKANIDKFISVLKELALSYDWDRCFATCDPSYYVHNQWLFLKLYEAGLAYRKTSPVKWCPTCNTVLANEQAEGGCWICGGTPEIRDLVQWYFRTTNYAQQMLDEMDGLQWSESVLTQQRNWIGRSEGATVRFDVDGEDSLEVFTTRPDTLFGATFVVVAPEHPLAKKLADRASKTTEYEAFLSDVRLTSEIDRIALRAERKTFDLGATATNPVNGESIPIYAADYVLMHYGTGAIMAVPAHDQRDFEFATQNGLEIRLVIQPTDGSEPTGDSAFEDDGVLANSRAYDTMGSAAARAKITEDLAAFGLAKAEVRFRMRDWLISRQRYWGTPIPIIHCPACGMVPVPYDQLPVVLPDEVDYQSTGGASPLDSNLDWVNVECPKCKGPAKRETDTMDTFVDSSWYFLRFCDPHNEHAPFDPDLVNAWMPVDQYTGGTDHAVMHLIYARFMCKALKDLGLVEHSEPFLRLLNQGWITMGGQEMSKSKGIGVAPHEVIEPYGVDTLRLHMLFIGPPDAAYDWPAEGVDVCVGSFRFLERVWRLVGTNLELLKTAPEASSDSPLRRLVHQKINAISKDFDRYGFNTAIAKMMELQAALSRAATTAAPGSSDAADIAEGVEWLLSILATMCPYTTAELWERLGKDGTVAEAPWPVADAELAKLQTVTLIIQVDGKVRDRVEVDADISEDDARELALKSEKVLGYLQGKPAARVVTRPPRLVNVLTRNT